MKEYNRIKEHIIKNFLNPGYLHVSVSVKQIIADTINKTSWFPVTYNKETDMLCFVLDEDIVVYIQINWENKESNGDTRFIIRSFG